MIVVEGLEKNYGSKNVLNNITFKIDSGESLGIVGRNGTGKTTLINILTGVERKDNGKVEYSFPINEFSKKVGIQMQDGMFEPYVKLEETYKLFCDLYHIPYSKINPLLKTLDLEHVQKSYLTKLSGGEKQKVNILLSLIHDPELLFFDEITTGLDAISRNDILKILSDIKVKKKSLVIVSHYFEEIWQLCDKLLVLGKDETLYYGEVKELGSSREEFSQNITQMIGV